MAEPGNLARIAAIIAPIRPIRPLLLIGVLFVATPDGAEIFNLTASVLLAIAFVPYGMRIITERQ